MLSGQPGGPRMYPRSGYFLVSYTKVHCSEIGPNEISPSEIGLNGMAQVRLTQVGFVTNDLKPFTLQEGRVAEWSRARELCSK